jgi:hypothetical protein
VIWGGEFGRTPHAQGNDGRDHNNKAFTMWMAGGGVKGGFAHGLTDDYGYEAVENKVHVHDLHATILHLLGLDHEKLTYRYAGRDFRLTEVYGNVVLRRGVKLAALMFRSRGREKCGPAPKKLLLPFIVRRRKLFASTCNRGCAPSFYLFS